MSETWNESSSGYPEPTVITIDEKTDLSKMHEKAQLMGEPTKIRRAAIGIKMFMSELEFLEWQKQEPREIFEITPSALLYLEAIKQIIFVTYAAGIIE